MFKKNQDVKEAVGYAAAGDAFGAGMSAWIGSMGLAGAFGAVAIGTIPVVGAGVVVGMAAYGIKKLID
jgi:hypothetical protein